MEGLGYGVLISCSCLCCPTTCWHCLCCSWRKMQVQPAAYLPCCSSRWRVLLPVACPCPLTWWRVRLPAAWLPCLPSSRWRVRLPDAWLPCRSSRWRARLPAVWLPCRSSTWRLVRSGDCYGATRKTHHASNDRSSRYDNGRIGYYDCVGRANNSLRYCRYYFHNLSWSVRCYCCAAPCSRCDRNAGCSTHWSGSRSPTPRDGG